MSDKKSFDELLAASSLGTPEAVALRESVPKHVMDRLDDLYRHHERERSLEAAIVEAALDDYDPVFGAVILRPRSELHDAVARLRAFREARARGEKP